MGSMPMHSAYRETSQPGCILRLSPLQQADAKKHNSCRLQLILQDEAAVKRLLKSYEMMLGFYGIKLVNRQTGQVCRADNWQQRFHNLNRSV